MWVQFCATVGVKQLNACRAAIYQYAYEAGGGWPRARRTTVRLFLGNELNEKKQGMSCCCILDPRM